MDFLLPVAASLGILALGFALFTGLLGIADHFMVKSWLGPQRAGRQKLKESGGDFRVLFSTLERKAIQSTELVYEYFGPLQAQWEFMLDTSTGLRLCYDLILTHCDGGSAWDAADEDLFDRLDLVMYSPCCSSALDLENLSEESQYLFYCQACKSEVAKVENEAISTSDLAHVGKKESGLRSWISGNVEECNPLECEIEASQLSDELVSLTKLLTLHFRDELRREELSGAAA